MKHLLLVYVPQNNCFYYLSNTNTPNTVLYYLLFQIVSEILFVFPNSPLVAKRHYLYLNSQIVKYQIAALCSSSLVLSCAYVIQCTCLFNVCLLFCGLTLHPLCCDVNQKLLYSALLKHPSILLSILLSDTQYR